MADCYTMQSSLFLCFCILFSSLSDCQCCDEQNDVSEISTEVQACFYEGNMSLLFLGYISLKIVLSIFFGKSSYNRFAAL